MNTVTSVPNASLCYAGTLYADGKDALTARAPFLDAPMRLGEGVASAVRAMVVPANAVERIDATIDASALPPLLTTCAEAYREGKRLGCARGADGRPRGVVASLALVVGTARCLVIGTNRGA